MMICVRDLIGCPYKVHGRNKSEGFDCYGLTMEVENRAGKRIPDFVYNDTDLKSNEQTAELLFEGISAKRLNRPEPYCLIAINIAESPSHIAVYLGGGKIIHSTQVHGVHISNIERYSNRVYGYYRVLEYIEG